LLDFTRRSAKIGTDIDQGASRLNWDGIVVTKYTRMVAAGLALAAVMTGIPFAGAQAADKVIRIGFQKYGTLVLLKAKGTLEKKLEAFDFKVAWTEFPSGPPLLEAINVGAIDFGTTGETPPIFAQEAGASILYVAHEPPAPKGEAILVPMDSSIKQVADLKSKKVALNKGSNVHYLLVKALERAGVKYAEIQPVFLAPADARAAFERGAVDAWAIWDPFQAAAQSATGARTLTDGTGIVANRQFYLAEQRFAGANPEVINAVVSAVGDIDAWAKDNAHAVAEELSQSTGVPGPILEVALNRQSYGIKPLDDEVVADQQHIADTFLSLGLIPKPINVSAIVRRNGS
jgi:sulfonate transport system substrate-binding protein